MGQLKGVNRPLPGAYGLNTQAEIVDDQAQRYASLATNGVIDKSGKLSSREDFVLQTAAFVGNIAACYNHRKADGTDVVMSAGSGVVYSDTATLSARFSYAAGSQIVDVGGAKTGATATGLANDATNYTYTIAVDGGAPQTIAVTGSAAQTYTTLLTEINLDVVGAIATLVGGNIKFISNTSGAASSISLVAGGGGTSLFTTLTNFVAVRTASTGTASNDNWQFASLNSRIFMAQKAQAFTCLLETTYAVESIVGQPWTSSPNIVIAAAGRLWAADDETGGNRYTVWWSNLLDGKVWNSGDAGSLNLQKAWPAGQDQIVAMAFLSGRLVIFGRNSILLYTLPADNNPATMAISDTLDGLGCSARDSVVLAGGDLYFLHDSGYYKLPRLAQVTSLLTIVKVSALVADDFVNTFAAEDLKAVRAGYFPRDKLLVVGAPVSNKTWCFHIDRNIPDVNVPAVTYWTNTSVPFRGFCYDKAGNWYAAQTNGIGKYSGYTPSVAGNAYSFDYYPQWTHLDDETKLKHLKSAAFTLRAAVGQVFTVRWQLDYKDATTRTASVTASAADFTDTANPGIGVVRTPIGGSCNVFRVGFTTPINGTKVAINSSRVFANPGATKIR